MEYYKTVLTKRILVTVMYILLVFAVFSDILRIPGSQLTFFRLSLPVIGVIFFMHSKYAKWLMGLIAGLGVLTAVQYIIFYLVDRTELEFSVSNLMKFFILYVLAFIVFFMIKFLKDFEKENFEEKGLRFIVYLGFCLMFVTVLDYLDTKYLNSQFFGALKVDNQNNYGCYIAALLPFLLVRFQCKQRLRDAIGIFAAFGIVFLHDSKAALFGMVLMGVIFICIAFPAQNTKEMFCYRYVIIICAIVIVGGLIIINPKIHGYSLQDTIAQPIIRVLTGNPYDDYQSSISYRTNTTLYCITQLVSTGFLGIGIGNTGVLLRAVFPDTEMAQNRTILSLHNAWLEFALDLGIVALVIYFILIRYAFKLYFTKRALTQVEKLRVMFIFSFPIWVMSASGIYTQYYLMVIMGYLLFCNSEKKLE